MFGLFKRQSQPAKPSTQRIVVVHRSLRGKYDAAQTVDENRRHWAHADGLSPDAANSPEVRRILRNRSRYEVANNSYAKGIVLTLANDTIGAGPRLQLQTSDSKANTFVERTFMAWAKEVQLAEKLRAMRMARAVDGESFLVFVTNARLTHRVKLDVRVFEADQMTTPDLSILDPNVTDGIRFDEVGNPVEYHLLRMHPGDMGFSLGLSYDQVPAAQVIHYQRMDRPGQRRGVPELTPALPLFAQLRRYTLAVLGAAETAADFAGVLYSDGPADGNAEDVEPMDLIELERHMLTTLPSGWKLDQIKAEQPTTTYGDFKHEILNEIARCLNMPYNVAAGNSSDYNYASGRLDHQTYHRAVRVEQTHVECMVLARIFLAWLNEAVLVEDFLPQSMRMQGVEFPHQWFWDGFEHVDPAKESTAQSNRLGSRTTSLAREYAKQGLDWEVELRQIAKEHVLAQELGVALPQPTGAAAEKDDTDVEEEEREPADAAR